MADETNARTVSLEFGNTIRKVGTSHVVTIPAWIMQYLREGQYVNFAVLEDDENGNENYY